MVIQRRKPHPTQPGQTVSIPYRLTDNPTRLSQLDWYRNLLSRITFIYILENSLSPSQETGSGRVCGWAGLAVQGLAWSHQRWLTSRHLHKKWVWPMTTIHVHHLLLCCVYKVDFKFLSSRPVVKAFHIRFEELRLDPNIQKWDVHVLQVSSMTYRDDISAPQDGV